MTRFFKYLSPRRAWRDLRVFFAERSPIELLFALPALVITGLVVFAFLKDTSKVEKPEYKPNIIYVESWPLDRSEADIMAKRKVDNEKKAEEEAEKKQAAKERQQQFKKMDDWLTNHGF